MKDERLQDLYARVLARSTTATRAAHGRERCVTPEELLGLVRREGPEERRLQVLDHIMACDVCRGEFELLRSIEGAGSAVEAAEAAPDIPRIGARGGWRRLAPLALAASVLLAVGLSIGLQRSWFGSTDGSGVMRGAADEVTALAPAGEIRPEAPITFAWRPVPGARRYGVEVLDLGGELEYADSTTDTVLVMRETGRLTPGAEYQWWVRASLDAGAQARSTPRRFRLRSE